MIGAHRHPPGVGPPCNTVDNCNTNNYITTYFRYTFNVPDRSLYTGLNLSVLRDDGVVVYLNGTEIWRDQYARWVRYLYHASLDRHRRHG